MTKIDTMFVKDFYCSCRQIEFISHSIWSSSDSSSFCRILKENIFLYLARIEDIISDASSGIKVRLMWILTLLDVEQPLLGHLVLSVELIFPKIVSVLLSCSDLTTLRFKKMYHKILLISYNSYDLSHSAKFSYTSLKIFILLDPLSKSKCSIIYLQSELVLLPSWLINYDS